MSKRAVVEERGKRGVGCTCQGGREGAQRLLGFRESLRVAVNVRHAELALHELAQALEAVCDLVAPLLFVLLPLHLHGRLGLGRYGRAPFRL